MTETEFALESEADPWRSRILDDLLPRLDLPDETINCALGLHKDQAPSPRAFYLIASHCAIVAFLAQELCQTDPAGNSLNARLAVAGGLIHDIGTYQLVDDPGSYAPGLTGKQAEEEGRKVTFHHNYIQHGILGYRYLLEVGADESLAAFARNHTGLGLSRKAVHDQGLDLPPDDYLPQTPEQEIVMYVDKFNSKSDPLTFVSAENYQRRSARFGKDNEKRWLQIVKKYGIPHIYSLADKYNLQVV